jgi:hypothetical protein
MGGNPKKLYVDGEGAIHSNYMKDYFAKRKIELVSTHGSTHNPIIERCIQTIKGIVEKGIEAQKTIKDKKKRMKPEQILEKAIVIYNNTVHRTIKVKPIDAWNGKDDDVMMDLADAHREHLDKDRDKPNAKVYEIGDIVRIAGNKEIFHKGYTQNFSDDRFTIVGKFDTNPVTYTVKNNKQKFEVANFYSQELILVSRPKEVNDEEPTYKNERERKQTKFMHDD